MPISTTKLLVLIIFQTVGSRGENVIESHIVTAFAWDGAFCFWQTVKDNICHFQLGLQTLLLINVTDLP